MPYQFGPELRARVTERFARFERQPIEDDTLRSRTAQRLGFVLAVKIHQRTAEG